MSLYVAIVSFDVENGSCVEDCMLKMAHYYLLFGPHGRTLYMITAGSKSLIRIKCVLVFFIHVMIKVKEKMFPLSSGNKDIFSCEFLKIQEKKLY